jgi:hypothetical protein
MNIDRHSGIALIVIGGVAVVLVAVAIAIAIQPTHEFDPGTPEGTAQAYFQAVLDEDDELAFSYLDEYLGTTCSMREFGYVAPSNARIVIAQTEIERTSARVDVVITETWGGGPFGGTSNTFDETLVMTRHGDRWLISRAPWPLNVICP